MHLRALYFIIFKSVNTKYEYCLLRPSFFTFLIFLCDTVHKSTYNLCSTVYTVLNNKWYDNAIKYS